MPCASACCEPTSSEAASGPASGGYQLPTGSANDNEEGEAPKNFKNDSCYAGNLCQEKAVAAATMVSPCAEIIEIKDNNNCGDTSGANKEIEPGNNPISGRAGKVQRDGIRATCEEGCCSGEPEARQIFSNPDCCVDRPAPCCDDSCLERMAVRECKQSTSCSDPRPSTDTGKERPCGKHHLSTKEKYAPKLRALGCVCRALLALGQESCCAPRQRSSFDRKRCSRSSSVASRKSVDSCCEAGIEQQECTFTVHPKAAKVSTRASCSGGCCSSDNKIQTRSPTISCCNGKQELSADIRTTKGRGGEVHDEEAGLSGKQHILFSVSGMTCTGCETTLKSKLNCFASVTNVKTSFLQSKAEFDLDQSSSTLEAIMRHLQRTTPFKYQQITDQGSSSLDVLAPNPLELVNEHWKWPQGVIEITPVDSMIVNIAFDAAVVGARDLVETGWSHPLHLAPPRVDPSLGAGAKHVRELCRETIISAILTIPVLAMAWAPLPQRELAYGSASLALASVVQFWIGRSFYTKTYKALVFSRAIEMDLLIVLSTTAAYLFIYLFHNLLFVECPLRRLGALQLSLIGTCELPSLTTLAKVHDLKAVVSFFYI